MSNYSQDYCDLICSAEHLDYCKRAVSVNELLMRIKQLWKCEQLGDSELLGEIALLNQIPLDTIAQTQSIQLKGTWLPYRYQPKPKLVHWLIPNGHATEPFHDEYISRCRQLLLNQVIQPCTSLEFLQQQATKNTAPAGFIFHLSRCGSTLISGCLAELDSTCVFSESPLLTELLLDKTLAVAEQKKFLQAFINLQAAAFPNRPQVIIKWNAWDIFRWDIIRAVYPQVPVIFLVRDPVEILASHQRSAGRHMAGDASLAAVHGVFNSNNAEATLLERQIRVLGALLSEMNRLKIFHNVLCIDYKQLGVRAIHNILEYFEVHSQPERFAQRLKFHSKTPNLLFSSDIHTKQNSFSASDKTLIQQKLVPLYSHIVEHNNKQVFYE